MNSACGVEARKGVAPNLESLALGNIFFDQIPQEPAVSPQIVNHHDENKYQAPDKFLVERVKTKNIQSTLQYLQYDDSHTKSQYTTAPALRIRSSQNGNSLALTKVVVTPSRGRKAQVENFCNRLQQTQ